MNNRDLAKSLIESDYRKQIRFILSPICRKQLPLDTVPNQEERLAGRRIQITEAALYAVVVTEELFTELMEEDDARYPILLPNSKKTSNFVSNMVIIISSSADY